MRTALQRSQTLYAAIRSVYFIPVFLQAFFLICMAMIYAYTICKGFFLMTCAKVFPRQQLELDFLAIIGFIAIAALLLCLNFILARISMNKRFDGDQLLYKTGYVLFSGLMLSITYLNRPLLYPGDPSFSGMFFYNNPYTIVFGVAAYLVILLLPFFYKSKNKIGQYIQLPVKISLTYFMLIFLLSQLLFLIYIILKLTVPK